MQVKKMHLISISNCSSVILLEAVGYCRSTGEMFIHAEKMLCSLVNVQETQRLFVLLHYGQASLRLAESVWDIWSNRKYVFFLLI